MSFPAATPLAPQVAGQDTDQVTGQVADQVKRLIEVIDGEMEAQEIQAKLNLAGRGNFRALYLKPALNAGFVEMTIPNKPNSRLQKYRLTALGEGLKRIVKS